MLRRMGRACLAGALAFGIAIPAFADVAQSRYTKEGDFHEFKDDLLNSDVAFPSGGDIRVRPMAKRVMLIRPRASFVYEMLKSVEKM